MRHCLIVDDSEVIRKVARKVLEEMNFTSAEADNTTDALDNCRRAMPDLVLLDWHMPKSDAHGFLQLMRHTEGGNAPVVIYCTTENDQVDMTRARHNGADAVLMKPYDQKSLHQAMRRAGFGAMLEASF
jgi:two-component system, chemotaxis family, chemotaxis protein CheY